MTIYNKIVRDRIPEIIKAGGKNCKFETLEDAQFQKLLRVKLHEEIQEYLKADHREEIEELSDIVEVIYAIAASKGVSIEEFEQVRLKKLEERGGFENKVFLKEVLPK